MQFINGKTQCYNSDGLEVNFGLEITHDFPVDFVLDGIMHNKKYFAFDLIPHQDFINDNCVLPLHERVEILSQFIGFFQEKAPDIKIIEKIEIELPSDNLDDYFDLLKNEGYTHFVAKNVDSLYSRTDKDSWLKCKIA